MYPLRGSLRKWLIPLAAVMVGGLLLFELLNSTNTGISIESVPSGARVLLDNVDIGVTPIIGRNLSPGRVSIRVFLASYVERESLVVIPRGASVPLFFTLQQEPKEEASAGRNFTSGLDGRVVSPEIRSPRDIAEVLARQLIIRSGSRVRKAVIFAFTFEGTGIPSPFSSQLQPLLEEKLMDIGEWNIVRHKRGATENNPFVSNDPDTLNAPLVVTGTIWERVDSCEFVAILQTPGGSSLLASSAVTVSGHLFKEGHLALRPPNLQRTVADSRPLGSGKKASGRLSIGLSTNKGRENLLFMEGDTIRVFACANRRAYIRVIYNVVDGRRILLTGPRDRHLSEANIGADVPLGEFICAPPFGEELVQAFASEETFEPTRSSIKEGLCYLTEDPDKSVALTRGIQSIPNRATQAEARLPLTTVAREAPKKFGAP